MRSTESGTPLGNFLTFATFVLVVLVLRVAEDVLIPVALAIMLAFLLSPVVTRLQRWGLPNALATIVTTIVAFAVIASVGWIVAAQIQHLVEEVPKYEPNLRAKIALLTRSQTSPDLTAATKMVERLQEEIQSGSRAEDEETGITSRPAEGENEPVPVRVVRPEPSPAVLARNFIKPLLGPLGTGAIVVVFVIAALLQRADLRDRFIKVVSVGRLNVATQAVDDAARRVSRYLGMLLVVNATYGIPIGIALHFIGIPSALLWGLLATLLRFIPFLGPWIAAAFPIVLAAAVEPGWSTLLLTIGLFVVAELISNNVIEIWLYGASTGISNFALLVAAVFWTWLWGTAGLFLSTPLTVCLLVLGKYVPGLKFLSVLLGSDPALNPPTLFYHRMLSMDFDEMFDLATRFVRERSVTGFYSDVFVPALILTEQDRHQGTLAEVRQRFIFQSGRELVEELERLDAEGNLPVPAKSDAAALPAPGDEHARALGIPARDDADELVALMLRHVLRREGVKVEVCPVTSSLEDHLAANRDGAVDIFFISALPPAALIGARATCKRVRELFPRAHILVGMWSPEAEIANLQKRFRDASPDQIVTTLSAAAAQLQSAVRSRSARSQPEGDVAPAAGEAPTELRAATATRLAEVPRDQLMDTVRRALAGAFGVPIALVNVEPADRQFWQAQSGLAHERPDEPEAETPTPLEDHMIASADLFIVEDTRKDPRFASLEAVTERGIRFFAGVPLFSQSGQCVGSLSITDSEPRKITEEHKQLLRAHAAGLMAAVEGGDPTAPGAAAAGGMQASVQSGPKPR